MNIQDIAEKMKDLELAYETRIPQNAWIVLRLDGRGFSSLTEENFEKPFDPNFHEAMIETAICLLEKMQGVYAYSGSDEISLLLQPNWGMFDRRLQKMISVSASYASTAFMKATKLPVQFDSRILSLQNLDEVLQYFAWRQADVKRCAIQTLAYWTLRLDGMTARQATKKLNKTSWQEKEALLEQKNVSFDFIGKCYQKGSGLYWEQYEKQGFDPIKNIEVMAKRWRVTSEHFLPENKEYMMWLTEKISIRL